MPRAAPPARTGSAPAGATAGVDDRLVADERQTVEDRGAPAGLRVGDAVVCRGVPIAWRAHRQSMAARDRRTPDPAPSSRGTRRSSRPGTAAASTGADPGRAWPGGFGFRAWRRTR